MLLFINIMNVDTNWYVITGGPSSGKTKVIEYLAFLGYTTVPEVARVSIDADLSRNKTIKEIRSDEVKFQKKIFQMKLEVEKRTSPVQIIFFERGIPDSIAYYRLYKEDPTPVIKASQKRKYRKVFLLEQLPFNKDYARVESKKMARNLSQLLYDAYSELGYDVVRVPAKPIKERVKFILGKLGM